MGFDGLNVLVLFDEGSFFLLGKGFNTVGVVVVGGNEENFFLSTAIGGNSTPRNVLAGNCSVSVLVDVVQRSCILRSRREIFSFCFVDNVSVDSIDEDATCSSIVNPVQILFLFVVSKFSLMTLVLFAGGSSGDDDVDDPSI
jgi:hypothetical protein